MKTNHYIYQFAVDECPGIVFQSTLQIVGAEKETADSILKELQNCARKDVLKNTGKKVDKVVFQLITLVNTTT